MKDKITFSNSFGEKYHMPADGPHRVTIGDITHAEPLAEQLKTVLQREADSQRRHDEKVERLEAENERLTQRYNELGNAAMKQVAELGAKVGQLEAEIERLRVEAQAQYHRGYYDGRAASGETK